VTTTLKVLGQLDSATPGAGADGNLYTVPALTQAVVSSVVVCNRSSAATFQIRVRVAGAAAADKQLIAKDVALAANTTMSFTLGLTLGAADVVTVQASTTGVSFSAFGQENVP
jgi:hypothetical protein